MSFCMCVFLSVSVCHSFCLSLSFCLSVFLAVSPICHSACRPVHLSVSHGMSTCYRKRKIDRQTIYPCLSPYPLSICLSLSASILTSLSLYFPLSFSSLLSQFQSSTHISY